LHICIFADFGQSTAPSKCVWRSGSARNRWGSYNTPPDFLAVIRGREGRVGIGRGGGGKGRGGEGDKEEGGSGRGE